MSPEESRPHLPGRRRTNAIEGAAISISLLCLGHCLGLPFLLLLLPGLLAHYAGSDAFHRIALVPLVALVLPAFWLGYRCHRVLRPGLLGACGVGCLLFALTPGMAGATETWLTVAGSLLLVAAHALNWRLRSHAT